MPANFNDKVIIESNGSIKLNGNTGNNKQALTSKGNATPEWTDVVNSVSGGTAIGVSGSSGDITINNEGVTSISAGNNITISGSTGAITISADDQNGGGGGGGSSTPVNNLLAGNGINLTPNNGNLNNNNVTVATRLCADSGLMFDSTNSNCLQLDTDEDACAHVGRLFAGTMTLRSAGTNNRPGIAMGVGTAGSGNQRAYLGITGSASGGRFRVTHDTNWDDGDCGGGPSGGSDDLFFVDLDLGGGGSAPAMKVAAMGTKPNGKGNMYWAGSGAGRVQEIQNPTRSELTIKTAANDTDVASFNVDSIIDSIGGTAATSALDTGLINFTVPNSSINQDNVGEIKYWPLVARPGLFTDDIATLHPSLVNWTWTDDSYEEYVPAGVVAGEGYGKSIRLVANPTPVAEDVNFDALTLLALVGLRRARNRLLDLEANTVSATYVDQRFAELIEAAPNTLNTLNELAAALGDDPNFASTVTTLIDTKLDASDVSAFGLTLIDDADAAAARTTLGLGTAAVADTSTFATAAQGTLAEAALPSAGAAAALGVTSLITLTGVIADSTDLGGFTGSTITDNVTIKVALQELETAVEARALATTVTEIDTDVTDLITLSGVAENSADLGTFTGSTITDNTTVKTALQEIETALEAAGATAAAPVLIEVHNASGATLNKGTPVYVSGTHASGIPLVESADANGTSTYPVIGLIHTNLTTGNAGFVVISGLLDELDTDSAGWNAGDALYLSETAGELVTTRPTANGTKVQKVALVTRRDATAGSLVVMGAGRTNDVPNELTTLLGTTLNDSDLGTFTGSIVTDNTSVKTAIQELETEIETKADLDGANIPGAFNNDTEAASNGVPVNGIYRNSNGTVHWRQS